MRIPACTVLSFPSRFILGLGLISFFGQPVFAAVPMPLTPTLNTPSNGTLSVPQANVAFSWSVSNASTAKVSNYRIVISRDANFSGFSDKNGVSTCSSTCFTTTTGSKNSYTGNMSLAGQYYYWKVRANGSSGASGWSVTRSFKTAGAIALTGKDLSFPSSGTGWSNTSGSPNHLTYSWSGFSENGSSVTKPINDQSAFDLNLNSPSYDSDKGRSVSPIANGVVVLNNSSSGFVVVKHVTPLKLDSGTTINTWYSGYMHMSSRNKPVGSTVSTRDVIGSIAAVGAGNNHLHFAIYKDGSTLSSINIKSELTGFASKISAWY